MIKKILLSSLIAVFAGVLVVYATASVFPGALNSYQTGDVIEADSINNIESYLGIRNSADTDSVYYYASSSWQMLSASSTGWEQDTNNRVASSSDYVPWASASTSNWDMAHGQASATGTIPFIFLTPSGGEEAFFRIPHGITIDRINCLLNPTGTTDQMDFEIYEADANGDATSTVDAVITCANTNTTDDGALTNPSIDVGDYLIAHLGTATGTINTIGISIDYRDSLWP